MGRILRRSPSPRLCGERVGERGFAFTDVDHGPSPLPLPAKPGRGRSSHDSASAHEIPESISLMPGSPMLPEEGKRRNEIGRNARHCQHQLFITPASLWEGEKLVLTVL